MKAEHLLATSPVDHIIFLHGRKAPSRDRRWVTEGLDDVLRLYDLPGVSEDDPRLCCPEYVDLVDGERPPDAEYPAVYQEKRSSEWRRAGDAYARAQEELRELRGARAPAGAKGRAIKRLPGDQAAWVFIHTRMPDVARYIGSDRTRRAVLERVCEDLPRSGNAIVIAHSLGTVVALDLLHFLPGELHIELLVTLGSPLALSPLRRFLVGAGFNWPYQRLHGWLNLFEADDLVTGGLGLERTYKKEVVDAQVDNGSGNVHAAHRYAGNAILARVLGPRLSETPKPQLPSDLSAVYVGAALQRTLGRRIQAESPPGSRRRARLAAAREIVEPELISIMRSEHPDVDGWPGMDDLVGTWPVEQQVATILELLLSNPYEPFQLELEERWHVEALTYMAREAGIERTWVQELADLLDQARDSHSNVPWKKILVGVGVGAVLVAAPVLAVGAIGAGAGLAGAAALTHGLAVLGGAMGAGMTGGLWVVGTVGAVGAAAAARSLSNLSPEQLEAELVKLQAIAVFKARHGMGAKGREELEAVRSLVTESEKWAERHREVEGSKSRNAAAWDRRVNSLERAAAWIERKMPKTTE